MGAVSRQSGALHAVFWSRNRSHSLDALDVTLTTLQEYLTKWLTGKRYFFGLLW
jgi:hypothetical protein